MEELHTWAPKLRVVVFHRCAQAFNSAFGRPGMTNSFRVSRLLGRDAQEYSVRTNEQMQVIFSHIRLPLLVTSSIGRLRTLIRRVLSFRDVVVVTSYEGMKSLKAFLLPCNWDYCVLDEGQRIRNPDAEVRPW